MLLVQLPLRPNFLMLQQVSISYFIKLAKGFPHHPLVTHIIWQGRCTLVATIQMCKILALNCLITAYSLSVQYLDGIKFGDYQMSIMGMTVSVCFLCILRAKVCLILLDRYRCVLIDSLSWVACQEALLWETPSQYFQFICSALCPLQFALHVVSLVYITNPSHTIEP